MAADFYRVLGVQRDATPDEIKSAYRDLAFRFHPDRNPEDPKAEARFKEISLAYAVLGNTSRKAEYDRESALGRFEDLDLQLDIEDLFRRVFGRFRRRRKRGEDLKYNLTVSFEDAVRGTEVRILVPRMVECETCDGEGIDDSRICSECDGEGRTQRRDTIAVPVPSGITTGRRLRVGGLGNAGTGGGRAGELFVIVDVEEHPVLRREGVRVVSEVPVTIAEAALGTQVDVPTIDGIVRLRVPAGTQPGQILRLAGRGAEGGDQHVTIRVVVPEPISSAQKKALEELRAASPRNAVEACANYDRTLAESSEEE